MERFLWLCALLAILLNMLGQHDPAKIVVAVGVVVAAVWVIELVADR